MILAKCHRSWSNVILGVILTPSNRRIRRLEVEIVPLLAGASRRTRTALFAEIKDFENERVGCLIMSATCMRINLNFES